MTRGLAIAILVVGCGATDPADDGPIRLRGACAEDSRVGGFRVEAENTESFVSGAVADAVNPSSVPEETVAAVGCRLLVSRNFFCDPACRGGELCGPGNDCQPFPRNQDVGRVTISGLATEVELDALAPGSDYLATTLPHPVFADGAEIRLRASGAFGEISLDGVGSPALDVDPAAWLVSRGEPMAIAWSAPAAAGDAVINLRLSIDQHGTTPATLSCDLADTGAAEIPSSMIDALLDAGVSGFANGSISRRTIDSHSVSSGCIDLEITSPRSHTASVAGHTPCSALGQCPAGQVCDLGRQTCVDE